VGRWEAKVYEVDGFEYITRHRNSKKKKKNQPFPEEQPNLDYDAYFSTSSTDLSKGEKLTDCHAILWAFRWLTLPLFRNCVIQA